MRSELNANNEHEIIVTSVWHLHNLNGCKQRVRITSFSGTCNESVHHPSNSSNVIRGRMALASSMLSQTQSAAAASDIESTGFLYAHTYACSLRQGRRQRKTRTAVTWWVSPPGWTSFMASFAHRFVWVAINLTIVRCKVCWILAFSEVANTWESFSDDQAKNVSCAWFTLGNKPQSM